MDTAYLPISCRCCTRVQLQAVAPGQVPTCHSCGAPCTVLPGATFAEADRPLFERIEQSVRRLHISRRSAEQVAWELRDVGKRSAAPEAVLLRVIDLLPTLDFLLPVLRWESVPGVDQQELTRATCMLATIVSARLRDLEAPGRQIG